MPSKKREPMPYVLINDPPPITDDILKSLIHSALGVRLEEYLIKLCEDKDELSPTA